MASQPQPLCPAVPCASPAGTGGAGLAGSPDKGIARPKPPVRPKPRVLPKPAVPAKPPVLAPAPAPRHPRPELPSAEKMNRLAGPQPYSGGGAGGPLRRPSFTVKSPETPNGKGLSSPPVAATEEEVSPAPPAPSRKGPAPFKVTPVPVAARPERFPGTTVEEILAKMDSRAGPGSPDRAWLSPFCTDSSSRFGSKTFAAFRKRPSGEADGDPASEALQVPQPAAEGTGDDGHPVAETSSSPPAGPSCAGDPRGRRRPPSPPDLSSLQLGALGPPGSPRPPTCPAPAPGAPFQPAEPSAPAPGSPDAPPELLAPDSPTLPPGSPESPARPPARVPVASVQAPGAPSATEPQLSVSRSPGSPHTPGEGSPGTASPPGTPDLPPRVTCPPGSPEAAAEYLGPPSPPLAKASLPPGSPEGPDDSAVSPPSPEGPDFNPPPRDVGLRRSSEGVLRPPPTGQGLGELGGSLSALPRPGDLLSEPSLGSESAWSLSQSFEWTFPSRGARLPAFPPRSPIRETPDSGLSEAGESDGEATAPGPPKDSRSEGSDSQEAEGAPCPGGPVAQREAEGSAQEEEEEEEEGEAERDAPVSHSPLHVTEPGQEPAEPESPPQPRLTTAAPLGPAPPDPAAPADSAWAGDGPKSLQGPGGPGQAEGPSQGPDPHADPGWLTELLVSPGVHSSPENLLGWSRKDLCSEFGIGRPRQDSTFDWSHPGVSRERDWPAETKQDQEFGTRSSWGSTHGDKDSSARESWSGDYRTTELMGDMKLGCSDWSQSLGTGESCLQDPDLSASTAKWGQGYGSTEELGSGQANWGSGLGTGHIRQLDKEPRSGQPTWAGRYSGGDTEMKDRELTPDWAGKYSSRDAGSKDKDLTLGWAGRSSTGDAGSPDKELSPGRPAWDRGYNPRDMESQDREFSPSRPAWTGEYRDAESQDWEFSPSRQAEGSEYSTGSVDSRDQEFSPSGAAWDNRYSTRDMESQDREFSPSRPAWTGEVRDMDSQDREFSPRRPAWTSEYREMESQDREFSPSRPGWDDRSSSRDTESWSRELSTSRPGWDDRSSSRDTESRDQELSPSRPAWDDRSSSRDTESRDQELSPSRLAWDDRSSSRDTESRDQELSPSRLAWDDRSSSRDTESRDQELSPSRPAEASECSTRDLEAQDEFSPSGAAWGDGSSTRDLETQDSEFTPSRAARDGRHSTGDMEARSGELFSPSGAVWDDRSSSRDVEAQDRESSPSGAVRHGEHSSVTPREEEQELIPARLSWPGEGSIGQTGLVRGGKEDMPSSHHPNPLAQQPSWGGAHQQERDSSGSRDWAEELRAAECHNQFGLIRTERVPDPCSARASDGSVSGVLPQPPQAGWHRDLSLDMGNARWSQDVDSWSVEPQDAEARRQEWASAFGARCAARSRDLGAGERSLGGDIGAEHGSAPSPSMGDVPADLPAAEPPWSESPSPSEEEKDPSEPAAAPQSTRARPLLPEAPSGIPADTGSEKQSSDHPDGESSSSWGEQQLSLGTPQPEGSMEQGQEFPLLEDTELLDSSVFRSKASLGRKRQHRAPSVRPTATEGDSWIFRDSTEPRPAPAASSDEEAAEEPRSRRMRGSPSGRGVKVPLFPGLSASAIKAKLRGRNRSAEEGTSSGESKGTPPKDPHVQRSKSCKIPGVSGKPPTLPPKPEKSSGSEASPPHWLQALKLKRKKP
ncbi:182 kDa tankyrase-1-binding protein isoform X2 [Corvus hawaiiensis]|uniref:182 kDa tankyrase-1-binding protein isoform X2 n=1 Tax=Corvus hawaiiensis TaxID=134902 RepID=UPI0020184548|nr:182 kDa tankyrase-1-binding protein isoform X2 [Corvus hawaiiensis]